MSMEDIPSIDGPTAIPLPRSGSWPPRLAVCVSGSGSTLQNLLDRAADGRLEAEVVLAVASKPGVGSIDRAAKAGVPSVVVERKGKSAEAFGAAIFGAVRDARADYVVLGGFLALLPIPDDFAHRVVNVHPSLIPAFCGRGFHGEAVHRAVLESGTRITGCTVHLADATYDTGPILLQRPVPVLDDDTPATLADRVTAAERDALPDALALLASGRLVLEGKRVRVVPPSGPKKA